MPTFSSRFDAIPFADLIARSAHATSAAVDTVLGAGRARSLDEFALLLSPHAGNPHGLEHLANRSRQLTQQHFGKVIRLFAPLYLSNECVNICEYCGFSRHNDIPRVTLPLDQVEKETRLLATQGFRAILLVAGEHPKYVSNGYVEACIRRMLPITPGINLELGPLETEAYIPLVQAGTEGLVVYQETYHEPTYRALHTAGPKKHYRWRMDTPERAYAAGFRRLGIGALFGLHDWRYEALAVAAHALHLQQHCWKAHLQLSFPRMRPAAGGYQVDPRFQMSDRELAQVIFALRWLLPHAGLVLSTRESPGFRDGMVQLGITNMSAGSSTEPGGYSAFDETQWTPTREQPGEQFHIADERPPRAVAEMIRGQGYEPVWKDFDAALATASETTAPALASA